MPKPAAQKAEQSSVGCEKHPGRETWFWCRDCRKPVCQSCIDDDDEHSEHNMTSFKSYLNRIIENKNEIMHSAEEVVHKLGKVASCCELIHTFCSQTMAQSEEFGTDVDSSLQVAKTLQESTELLKLFKSGENVVLGPKLIKALLDEQLDNAFVLRVEEFQKETQDRLEVLIKAIDSMDDLTESQQKRKQHLLQLSEFEKSLKDKERNLTSREISYFSAITNLQTSTFSSVSYLNARQQAVEQRELQVASLESLVCHEQQQLLMAEQQLQRLQIASAEIEARNLKFANFSIELNRKQTEMKKEIVKLEKQSNSLKSEIDGGLQSLNQIVNESQDTKATLDAQKAELLKTKTELAKINPELARVTRELNAMRQKMKSEQSAFDKFRVHAEKERKKLKLPVEIAKRQNLLAEIGEKMSENEARVEKQKDQIQSSQETLDHLKNEIEKSAQQHRDITQNCEEM